MLCLMTTYLMKMFHGLVVPMVQFSVNIYLKKNARHSLKGRGQAILHVPSFICCLHEKKILLRSLQIKVESNFIVSNKNAVKLETCY